MKKSRFARVTNSDTKPDFTVHSGRLSCLVTGQCSIWGFKFCIVKCIVESTWINLLKWFNLFSEIHFWLIERIGQMNDQREKNIQGSNVFDDNSHETKSCSCLGQPCSRILIVFLSQLYVSLLMIFVCFLEFIFQKRVTNLFFRWEFFEVHKDTI